MLASGAEKPIELRALTIEAEVLAAFAQTTVEMQFYNPNGRVLEGELQFPLADGLVITGFALSMPGGKKDEEVMREAVPVDKAKGRQVFEEVIRQKIDPALLEVTQGNNFKLRVYPLNPGETRRVRLTYSERLPHGNQGVLYRLPLAYTAQSANLAVSIKSGAAARIDKAPAGLSLTPQTEGGAYRVHGKGQNIRLAGNTENEIRLQIPTEPGQRYLGRHAGKTYFYTAFPPPKASARALPQNISLLWDASLSGQKRDHAKEFAFLEALFTQTRNARVRLQMVRDVADAPQEFVIANGNWAALKKALADTIYDGATNLSALDTATKTDLYLLFSDGLDNYSLAPPAAPTAPLHAVISSPGADTVRLKQLAATGALIDLQALDASSALARITQSRPHIVAVEGSAADAVWSSAPDGSLLVAGVVTDAAQSAHVIFSDGSRSEIQTKTGLPEFDAIPALWAALTLEKLEAEHELNRGAIRRLGKEFGLPTSETSLIVLDRVEDYVTHDIAPPPELKAEYDRLRAQTTNQRQGQAKNKIERVLTEWQARDAWWEKDFPKGKPPQNSESIYGGAPRVRGGGRVSGAPATMGAPAPGDSGFSSEPPAVGATVDMPEGSGRAGQSEETRIAIQLRPWTPDAPYITRMKAASNANVYRVYLDERPDYENSVAFYLDVADQLKARGLTALSLRVLSNLAEINLENRQILRVLGRRLLEADAPKTAVLIFNRVLRLADDEAQSWRDLGLAYDAAGEHQLAVDHLYDAATRPFPREFPGLAVIALTEMNAIIASAKNPLDTRRIDSRFLQNRPLDLRVVLSWDSDNTDIDLHLIDPNGEEAFYGHALSYQGGRVSPDNTAGYGPEEYTLKRAKPGKYRVEINFYGHQQQAISEATTVQLDFFTRYASTNVKKQSVTLRLKERGDRILVGEFEVGKM
jgi:tetratricopeptide (TPR) repeat protein